MSNLQIYHMASFSRSGETLLLRCLNSHSRLHVVHDLLYPDNRDNLKLFNMLRSRKDTLIDRTHPRVKAVSLADQTRALVLKNAVWSHRFPFKGFILVRNPFSIAASFNFESSKLETRYLRWAEGIEPRAVPALESANVDNVTKFCMLYNLKMYPLARSNLPILRYEDFVEKPRVKLKLLIEKLGLEWDESVINSHLGYSEGTYGHGGIPLWKPIHKSSIDKYKQLPGYMKSQIYSLTKPTLESYGYCFDSQEITLSTRPMII